MTRDVLAVLANQSLPSVRRVRVPAAVQAITRRMSWGVADQAVSSITNFAVGIVVARTLGAAAFGVFSIAWVTFAVVLNLSRGLTTDPLTVRNSGTPDERWRGAARQASNSATAVGLATGALGVIVGLAAGGPIGQALVALGLVLPVLLLQDSFRYAFFAAGQGQRAFVNDLVWAAALVPAMLLASASGSVSVFVLAWGASAGVAALFGCLQTRLVPTCAGVPAWLRRHRDLGLRYMVENVSVSAAAQVRMYGLGAIAGLADVGAVRGAQLLLGPFLAVLMGVSLVSVPEAARLLRRAPHRLPAFCILIGGGQAAAGLLWGLALLVLLPPVAGSFLLGAVWPAAAALIFPTTLVVMGGSMSDGAVAGLRALEAAPRSMRTRLITATAYVIGGLVGAELGHAAGSAWGVAVAMAVSAGASWWQLRGAMRDHGQSESLAAKATRDNNESMRGDL